jgi:hypothetical protein
MRRWNEIAKGLANMASVSLQHRHWAQVKGWNTRNKDYHLQPDMEFDWGKVVRERTALKVQAPDRRLSAPFSVYEHIWLSETRKPREGAASRHNPAGRLPWISGFTKQTGPTFQGWSTDTTPRKTKRFSESQISMNGT